MNHYHLLVREVDHGRLSEVALFESNAFHNEYKGMFAEVCPESNTNQTRLSRLAFHGLIECPSVSKISPNGPTALFNKTQTALLMTFLECEVQRSNLLQFSNVRKQRGLEP